MIWRSRNILFSIVALLSASLANANFYKILGIKKKATSKEIKKAYRAKSLQFHPDKNKEEGASDKFSEIARAYEVLSDESLREIYDERGEEGLKQHEGGGGQGNGFGGGGFDDIFSHFGFGGQGQGRGQGGGEQKTPSVSMPLRMTLEEIYIGNTIDVEYLRETLCMHWEECMKNNQECQGPGIKVRMQQIAPGFVQQVQQRDDRCVSRGKMWKSDCRACPKGQTETEKIDLTIEVPPGMRAGEHITFEGVADEKPGLAAGDLHFVLKEIGSSTYHRDGDHLYTTIEIPLVDALTGFKSTLTHLDGKKFVIDVNTVTECDHTMRVPGKGMPRRSGRGFGDMYITFEVDFPETLTVEQKEGIRKILGSQSNDEL